MCTVTYLPTADGVLITSNRDEKIQRTLAIPPQNYQVNGIELVYPKDQDAAGSWIAMQETGQIAVLLNGAFQNHQPANPYNRSRGLVLLDIVASNDQDMAFKEIDLTNIEPFTLILYNPGKLTENRWDGHQKHSRPFPSNAAHIWSSVTLYDEAVISSRQKWFREWLAITPVPDADSIQQFHLFGGKSDAHNNFRMNRNNEMLTVSVTCISVSENEVTMFYTDLQQEIRQSVNLKLINLPQLPACT